MQDIQPELIEKYQLLLEKDPKSQVFAPLTEAYRKMGLTEEAFRIAVRGVQFNPNFSGGRIALAKVFLDRDNVPGAVAELEKTVDLSPDNILAHSLLGECYLKTKRPKEALKSYKMVLFLAPTNEKAAKTVKKLESLTADEYDDDLFEMKPLPQLDEVGSDKLTPLKPVASNNAHELERILSLTDAYIVRNDIDKAFQTLREAERSFGTHPELIKRMKLVSQRSLEGETDEVAPPPSRKLQALDNKIALLRELLGRVREHS